MICRTCLRRVASLVSHSPRPIPIPTRAAFSTSLRARSAATAAVSAPTPASAIPADLTPLEGAPTEDPSKTPGLSSCVAGTVLTGLNYMKGKEDPVALADEEYPAWLWRCLEVTVKHTSDGDDVGGVDEFTKSKKQRRILAKRQRLAQAKILESGDLSSLAPKIPLQHQTVNLPDGGDGSVEDAMHAVDGREALRQAMRKERKAKIKEANYLKSM